MKGDLFPDSGEGEREDDLEEEFDLPFGLADRLHQLERNLSQIIVRVCSLRIRTFFFSSLVRILILSWPSTLSHKTQVVP